MRRLLAFLVLLVVFLGAFVLWASSGTLGTHAWVDRYDHVPIGETMFLPDTLTIMTYNIGYLSGMANNRAVARDEAFFEANLRRAAGAIGRARPHVVAFQEIDVHAQRSYFIDQVEAIGRGAGLSHAAVAVNWDERYVPFPSANPRYHFGRMVSAQSVLSRIPIDEHRRIVLPSPPGAPLYGTDSWLGRLAKRFYIDRLAQVVILDATPPLAVVNVHLEAWDAPTRESQVERLITLFDELDDETSVFLAGDFNSVMPAARNPQRLAPNHLDRFRDDRSLDRLIAQTGLVEVMPDSVYTSADTGTYTFSSAEPMLKIDHIFYDPERYAVLDARVLDVPGPPSDHRPVVARFVRKRGEVGGGPASSLDDRWAAPERTGQLTVDPGANNAVRTRSRSELRW